MHLCNACGVVEFGLGKKKSCGVAESGLGKKKSCGSTNSHYTTVVQQNWIIKIKDDGGRPRTLCCHPFNAALLKYGKYPAEHKSDCGCPLHKEDTYWRRLSSYLLTIRNNAIKHKKSSDIKKITGIDLHEYLSCLTSKFRKMYNGILSDYELMRSTEDLSMCKLYTIDEWFPRCAGKRHIVEGKLAQARFFARVFSVANTRLIVDKKSHAETLGLCIVTHKDIINNKKVGKILPEAALNFEHIEPSHAAISFWYDKIISFNGGGV